MSNYIEILLSFNIFFLFAILNSNYKSSVWLFYFQLTVEFFFSWWLKIKTTKILIEEEYEEATMENDRIRSNILVLIQWMALLCLWMKCIFDDLSLQFQVNKFISDFRCKQTKRHKHLRHSENFTFSHPIPLLSA